MFQTSPSILQRITHRVADAIAPTWGETPAAPRALRSSPFNYYYSSGDLKNSMFSFGPEVATLTHFQAPTDGFTNAKSKIYLSLQDYAVTEDGGYMFVRIPNGSHVPRVLDALKQEFGQNILQVNSTQEMILELVNSGDEMVIPLTGFLLGSLYYEQRDIADLTPALAFALIAVCHPLIAGRELTVFGFRPPVFLDPRDYGHPNMVTVHKRALNEILNTGSPGSAFLMQPEADRGRTLFAEYMYVHHEAKTTDTVTFRRTPQAVVSLYRKGADPEKHLPLTSFNTGRWFMGPLMKGLFSGYWKVEMLAEVQRTFDFLMSLPAGHGY